MTRETRADARARIEREIMSAARRQLAETGAAGLSLREVAREVGMVSSAVYRYVESRDELLTLLIVEVYDELGGVAEAAAADEGDEVEAGDLDRWATTAHAIRTWALDHPHDYLLLFGSPVPGYVAPETTIPAGTRATFALVGIVAQASAAGRLAPPATEGVALSPALTAELLELTSDLAQLADDDAAGGLTPDTVVAFIAAWTQLYGLISFEITNQTRNVVTDSAALFDVVVRRLGYQVGLR